MLKGVNHQIIEIRQTDNPYFDRALLFVSAAYTGESADHLQREGKALLDRVDGYSGLRQAHAMRWFRRCVLVLGGAFLGMWLGIWLSGALF